MKNVANKADEKISGSAWSSNWDACANVEDCGNKHIPVDLAAQYAAVKEEHEGSLKLLLYALFV